MNRLAEAASLSKTLLVAKGDAAPSRLVALGWHVAQGGAGQRRPGAGARLSLRLDEPGQRRLRLAAAHLRKSGQELIREALNHYLDRVMPGLIDGPCRCIEGGACAPRFARGLP